MVSKWTPVKGLFAQVGTIGKRLKLERERLGFNQSEMAEKGGVQKRAQIRYEGGDRPPDADYLEGIAKAGADVHFIITGDTQARLARELDAIEASLSTQSSSVAEPSAIYGQQDLRRKLQDIRADAESSDFQRARVDLLLEYLGDADAMARRRRALAAMGTDLQAVRLQAAKLLEVSGWTQPPVEAVIILETLLSHGLEPDVVRGLLILLQRLSRVDNT